MSAILRNEKLLKELHGLVLRLGLGLGWSSAVIIVDRRRDHEFVIIASVKIFTLKNIADSLYVNKGWILHHMSYF